MRYHKLDLNLLVVLDKLLTNGNVSHTAQQLFMTQPAISMALARLRAHFEDELLVQVGRRMMPTAFAESLRHPVREALNELEHIAMNRADFDPGKVERTFSIVASDYVYQVFLTVALRRLREVAPNIVIKTLPNTEQAADLLTHGLADLLLVPDRRTSLEHPSEQLFTDRFVCVVWRHNNQVKKKLTLDQYVALRHVSTVVAPSTLPTHIEEEALARNGVRRQIAIYAPNFTSAAETVIGTDLIATIQERLARSLAPRMDLRILEPPIPIPPFTELLQWHKNKKADPGIVWLRDFLKAQAAAG